MGRLLVVFFLSFPHDFIRILCGSRFGSSLWVARVEDVWHGSACTPCSPPLALPVTKPDAAALGSAWLSRPFSSQRHLSAPTNGHVSAMSCAGRIVGRTLQPVNLQHAPQYALGCCHYSLPKNTSPSFVPHPHPPRC